MRQTPGYGPRLWKVTLSNWSSSASLALAKRQATELTVVGHNSFSWVSQRTALPPSQPLGPTAEPPCAFPSALVGQHLVGQKWFPFSPLPPAPLYFYYYYFCRVPICFKTVRRLCLKLQFFRLTLLGFALRCCKHLLIHNTALEIKITDSFSNRLG